MHRSKAIAKQTPGMAACVLTVFFFLSGGEEKVSTLFSNPCLTIPLAHHPRFPKEMYFN